LRIHICDFDCLEIVQWILSQDWCFISTVYCYITRTDFNMSTVPAHTRAGDIFSTTTPNCRPVTAAHELVTQSRLRYLSTVVSRPPLRFFSSRRPGRARTATRASYVLAAHEPSTSAVLLPRCSHATSVRNLSDIIYRTIRT